MGLGDGLNQIPEQRCSVQFGQKFLEDYLACASQIVSHILRMWRLNHNDPYAPYDTPLGQGHILSAIWSLFTSF